MSDIKDELRRIRKQLNTILKQQSAAGLLLTATEAAKFLGHSRSKFYELSSERGFPAPVRAPGRNFQVYRRADLDRWVSRLKPGRKKAKVNEVQ